MKVALVFAVWRMLLQCDNLWAQPPSPTQVVWGASKGVTFVDLKWFRTNDPQLRSASGAKPMVGQKCVTGRFFYLKVQTKDARWLIMNPQYTSQLLSATTSLR